MLEDLSALWRQHPILGTGLGTHEVVFPAYNRAPTEMIATHAENEYAQLMEETGASGCLLAIWFLAVVIAAGWRLLRKPQEPIHFAAFGLAYGLLCILIHSASDFGQHMPAVAGFTAITCALILQLDRSRASIARDSASGETATDTTRASSWTLRQGGWGRRAATLLTLAVILTSAAWALAGLNNQRLGAADWREAEAIDNSLTIRGWSDTTNEELAELLERTESAIHHDPLNINYRYVLNQFRWHAVSRVRDPDTGEVLLTGNGLAHVKAIVADLQANKTVCPTFGLIHSLAGQLQWFVLSDEAGKADIRTGYRLAPYHRSVALTAGLLEAQEGQWEVASPALNRAIMLDGSSVALVLDTCLKAGRVDVARSLAKGDRGMLQQLASRLQAMPGQQEVAAACLREAEALTRSAAEQAGASPASLVELAELHVRNGNKTEAIKCYQNALGGDYGQVPWRLRLARLLADTDQPEEAIRQARLCLRLRPQLSEAQGLISELATRNPTGLGSN